MLKRGRRGRVKSLKSTRVKGKEYLVARRSVGGEREERSLGRLDGERRKALEAAGITLQGGRA